MKLEDQIVSLELSKKLKELGVTQHSLFKHDTRLKKIAWSGDIQTAPVDFGERYIAAFTVAELGEMLKKGNGTVTITLFEAVGTEIRFQPFRGEVEIFLEDTEADARAKMLIYLLENKLLTL